MKNLRKVLAVAGLFAMSLTSAFAQEAEPEYIFQPHFYLNLQGGASYTRGEADFSDLLSPAAQVGLGYQFSPLFGLRFSVSGWESKGGWVVPDVVYDWNYVAPNLDLTFNLSNAFCGFNPKRFLNVSIFAGAFANIGFNNDEAMDLAANIKRADNYNLDYAWDGTKVRPGGRFGLDLDMRVSDKVSILVEGNANVLTDKYNSKKAGNADWYFNVLAGVKINLGKTYTKKEIPAPVVVEQPAPAPAPKPAPAPAPKPAPKATDIIQNVFFTIRSSEIVPAEQVKVDEIVKFLKENPNAKVALTGYADAGTGNAKINQMYSENRADVVEKALIDAGISADRISKEAKGDTVQPFSENDKNRVTIVIAK